MKTSGWIEIELLNGKHILVDDAVERIHDVSEKIKTKVCFSCRFPFLKVTKVRYTEFQCHPKGEAWSRASDPVYRANCRLVQFMHLIGVEVKPFPYEQFQIENDLHG